MPHEIPTNTDIQVGELIYPAIVTRNERLSDSECSEMACVL